LLNLQGAEIRNDEHNLNVVEIYAGLDYGLLEELVVTPPNV
jgi:hypothetical protein